MPGTGHSGHATTRRLAYRELEADGNRTAHEP